MSAPPAKRQSTNVNPAQLSDRPEIIKLVLSFVGRGEYLFVGGISRAWRMLYMASYPSKPQTTETTCSVVSVYQRQIIAGSSVFDTAYSSAFSSEARLLLALDSHLPLRSRAVALAAGKVASRNTICLAWRDSLFNDSPPGCVGPSCAGHWPAVCYGAASAGRIDVLRWLIEERAFPFLFGELASIAFERGDLELLQYAFSSVSEADSVDRMTAYDFSLMAQAGACSNLSLLSWLATRCYLLPDAMGPIVNGALKGKRLSTLKWLKRKGQLACKDEWLTTAALNGDAPMFRFLVDAGCSVVSVHGDDLLVCCALGGSVELLSCVEELLDTSAAAQPHYYRVLVTNAGMMGHVDAMKHLLAQGALRPTTL
jgi:hypothetical protein